MNTILRVLFTLLLLSAHCPFAWGAPTSSLDCARPSQSVRQSIKNKSEDSSKAVPVDDTAHHMFLLFSIDNQKEDVRDRSDFDVSVIGSKGTVVDLGVRKLTLLSGNCLLINRGREIRIAWSGETLLLGSDSEVELSAASNSLVCTCKRGTIVSESLRYRIVNSQAVRVPERILFSNSEYRFPWQTSVPRQHHPCAMFATAGTQFGFTTSNEIFMPRGLAVLITRDDGASLKMQHGTMVVPKRSSIALRCDDQCNFVGNFCIESMSVNCSGREIPLFPSTGCALFNQVVIPGSQLCDGIPRRNHCAYVHASHTIISSGYSMLAFMRAIPSIRAAVLKPLSSNEQNLGSDMVKTLACIATVKGSQGDYEYQTKIDKVVNCSTTIASK